MLRRRRRRRESFDDQGNGGASLELAGRPEHRRRRAEAATVFGTAFGKPTGRQIDRDWSRSNGNSMPHPTTVAARPVTVWNDDGERRGRRRRSGAVGDEARGYGEAREEARTVGRPPGSARGTKLCSKASSTGGG